MISSNAVLYDLTSQLDPLREASLRIALALALHDPAQICLSHYINNHDCGGEYLYRCATCARTSSLPCPTWRTLTGREHPSELEGKH